MFHLWETSLNSVGRVQGETGERREDQERSSTILIFRYCCRRIVELGVLDVNPFVFVILFGIAKAIHIIFCVAEWATKGWRYYSSWSAPSGEQPKKAQVSGRLWPTTLFSTFA